MTVKKQEIMKLFAALAAGDFTCRAQGDDELIRQANRLAEQLEARMFEQLDDMVGMTMNAFEKTITMGGLEQDVAHLDEMAMASASEEMSANVTHVAERIDQAVSSMPINRARMPARLLPMPCRQWEILTSGSARPASGYRH